MAQRKLKRTRYWIQQLDRDAADFKGIIQGLRSTVDADLPLARARLDNMIQSLEAYVRLAPPARAVPTDDLAPEERLAATAESTVRSPTEQIPALIQRIRTLRELTPSRETRDKLSVSKVGRQGLSELRPLDALIDAINGCAQEACAPQDKVLLHLDMAPTQGIYLERGPADQGDSGWTIGSTDQNTQGDYAAVSLADLMDACPLLQGLLALPQGYVVLLDQAEQTQALADAQDKLIWSTKLEGSTP